MVEFATKTDLKEYLKACRAKYDRWRYESADSQMALDSYLRDFDGDPKSSGLLAFFVKEGLPGCAMYLIKLGANVNDTLNNRSALNYLHHLNPKDFYETTRKDLAKLERILVKKGAKDFVKPPRTIRIDKVRHAR